MKEICFDARMLRRGGIGTYIRNLLPGLKASSFQLKVLIHSEVLEKEPWLQQYDLIFIKGEIYSIREQLELPLRIPAVDLFFSPHYNIPLAPIRAKKRAVTIHDVFHLAFASTLNLPERIYAKQVIRQATRRSDAVITVSHFSASEICKYTHVSNEKVNTIYLGVDRKNFQKMPLASLRAALQKFQLPKKYFLFVGNLKPHKNITNLILAMKEISADFSLVLVGSKENMKNVNSGFQTYETLPELQGRVQWLTNVSNEELPALYQGAEALILPSYYEGFGLPVLEAMSCGCPVIASYKASLSEVCGPAALYINPNESIDLALAMKKLTDSTQLRQEMIEKGHINLDRFDWEKTIEQHVALFEKICAS